MDRILAQLTDADMTLTLERKGEKYRFTATRSTSVSTPEEVVDKTLDSLGLAIKEMMIFAVSEWESVFIQNRLSEKMEQAITAA